MNALKPYTPSKAARAIIAAGRRALSAPAPRLPMCGDPNFMQIDTLREGRAMLERRACQYAAWMAAAKFPTLNLQRLNARFDGYGRVWFHNPTSALGDFWIDIPAHVLAFDPNAPALALPAPDAEPAPAPRCEATASLALEAPAEIAPAPMQREAPTATADLAAPVERKTAKAAHAPRKRPAKWMREFEESRAMRAARIAQLPAAIRRQIGAR